MSRVGVCQECGENFIRKKARQLFCQPRCANKFYRNAERERLRVLREQANINDLSGLVTMTKITLREALRLCSDHIAEKITTEEFIRRTEILVAELEAMTQTKQ